MIFGWGWSCGSVFSAYLLTLARSICKLFCGFFDSVLFRVVLVGQLQTSLFSSVICESLCTARIYACGFRAPLCFLVFASTKQKIKSQGDLSFKWQATGCSLGVCVGTDKVVTNIGIYFRYKKQICCQERNEMPVINILTKMSINSIKVWTLLWEHKIH